MLKLIRRFVQWIQTPTSDYVSESWLKDHAPMYETDPRAINNLREIHRNVE